MLIYSNSQAINSMCDYPWWWQASVARHDQQCQTQYLTMILQHYEPPMNLCQTIPSKAIFDHGDSPTQRQVPPMVSLSSAACRFSVVLAWGALRIFGMYWERPVLWDLEGRSRRALFATAVACYSGGSVAKLVKKWRTARQWWTSEQVNKSI